MVGRLLIGLLVLVSALVGATAGLPAGSIPSTCRRWTNSSTTAPVQLPSSMTIRGAPSDHSRCNAVSLFPTTTIRKRWREALISIEDKDFYRH